MTSVNAVAYSLEEEWNDSEQVVLAVMSVCLGGNMQRSVYFEVKQRDAVLGDCGFCRVNGRWQ